MRVLVLIFSAALAAQDAPVRILIDQPARAVEYQLGRLTNDELARIERKDDDPRYRLVYVAMLTRKGLARALRDEALTALAKLDRATRVQVLLDALAKIPAEDDATANTLASMLAGQPPDTLRGQRDALVRATEAADVSPALRGAYAGLLIVDGSPDAIWQSATRRAGHLTELVNAAPLLPGAGAFDALRAALGTSIAQLIVAPTAGVDAETTDAAVRALRGMPPNALPSAQLDPIARALVARVSALPPAQRTDPAATEAIQLGEQIADALPAAARTSVRRDLRAIGVRVVRIETVPEQMLFNVKWFVVEAGKPVQLVLVNKDATLHNLIIGRPGSLERIGTAAMTMAMPSDPAVKPYVPAGPMVLRATGLLKEGETERLNFTAPADKGEYPFACTFPGHWMRMYGVMLVVDNLEAWEAAPTPPTDPITNRPFAAR
jgi:azurin